MENLLETDRLTLQCPKLEDLDDFFHLCSNPEVNRHNPAGADHSIADSRRTLESFIADWDNDQVGYYSAKIRATGEYLGYLGVRKKRFLGINVLNLAYRIEPKFQRRGYTYEACRFILDSLDSKISQMPIMALTKSENIPSIQLAIKLGLTHKPRFNDFPEPGDRYFFSANQEIF